MNRHRAIAGMALLTSYLVGWACLAGTPSMGKPPSADAPPKAAAAVALQSDGPSSGLPYIPPPPNSEFDKHPATPPPGSAQLGTMPVGPAGSPALPTGGPVQGAERGGAPPGGATQPLNGVPSGSPIPPLRGGAEANELSLPGSQAIGGERSPESALGSENLGNRQEPAVSLEWVGPTAAKVNQPTGYSLVVRNICNIPVQQVLVRVRIPPGLSCGDTEPKASAEGNVLIWELGALQAKEEKTLRLKLLAEQKGDAMPQAWVTFTGSSVMHIRVREPKLTLKAEGAAKLMLGETAAFQLTVANPGDGAAEQVKIHALLTEGLECPRGNKIDFDIGNLAAGESRNVTIMCVTKQGGNQTCTVTAKADGGLSAKDAAQVSVTMPRLELQLVGPGLRYLGRKALYTLKVQNPGDAAATNVTLSDVVPEGFKILAASDGGRHDFSAHTVSWFLGEIKPGEAREVKLEVQAVNPGEFKHKANAVGAHNLSAEAELATRVEGLSALMLEMVDTEDPIEVSSETSYEVRITNTGSKVETDIKLIASIPDKMEFKSATGPARFHAEGKTIVFDPLEKLAPKADAVFHIKVKALDQGIVRFKIQMTSINLTEPVIKMEATRIYSDAPETKTSH
jgi:uncharacterized repeat protein (TIGR01451 family)